MENVEFLVQTGGIFSKFIRLIDNANNYKNFDKFKFCCSDCSLNFFEDIFIFDNSVQYEKINASTITIYKDIVNSQEYLNLKNIVSKLTINPLLETAIEEFVSTNKINENTLGVHIRLTDMNTVHPEYGIVNFNDYLLKIETLLQLKNYSNMYVSSDNHESINKLKLKYGNFIIFKPTNYRVDFEHSDLHEFQKININTLEFWKDVFFDMLVLSKTGTLINRVSNFSNAALLFSNSISKNISIN